MGNWVTDKCPVELFIQIQLKAFRGPFLEVMVLIWGSVFPHPFSPSPCPAPENMSDMYGYVCRHLVSQARSEGGSDCGEQHCCKCLFICYLTVALDKSGQLLGGKELSIPFQAQTLLLPSLAFTHPTGQEDALSTVSFLPQAVMTV